MLYVSFVTLPALRRSLASQTKLQAILFKTLTHPLTTPDNKAVVGATK